MTIPLTHLRDLPQGASYHQQQGRAHLRVRTLRDTLLIDASCDSLQQLVTYYSQRSAAYQRIATQGALRAEQAIESYHKSVKTTPSSWWLIAALALGFIAAVLYIFQQPICRLFGIRV